MEKEFSDWEKKFIEDCEKATSTLDMPLAAYIETPLCKICIYSHYYETLEDPHCDAFNSKIPEEYDYCYKYDCPKFVRDYNSGSNDEFDENHQPKRKPPR